MFHIILVEPEIPPNTGNIIRLTANTGTILHLVRPMKFDLSDKQVRRAGLDYHDLAHVEVHDDLDQALEGRNLERVFAFSTKANRLFSTQTFKSGDVFVFGPETRGLSLSIRNRFRKNLLRIPMRDSSRSLNLGNSVAVAVYEAWRQTGYEGGN